MISHTREALNSHPTTHKALNDLLAPTKHPTSTTALATASTTDLRSPSFTHHPVRLPADLVESVVQPPCIDNRPAPIKRPTTRFLASFSIASTTTSLGTLRSGSHLLDYRTSSAFCASHSLQGRYANRIEPIQRSKSHANSLWAFIALRSRSGRRARV
ncbi:hypothetical protein BOTBODRAFT_366770 [Botryobasidium botryosum FD-172 SS1]|uniref:Uncharacterized protein n=1 Tax=Botryobasidium botryosum (strain FD-172 SS1) TaxID=930990 RepID=A0A067MDT8_BOTB1|nr:hypothetical protein BOTBODRAFT_366770 [Botryobasidium botryosum FD-172 SS1]